jgi:hypothetical protein
VIGYVCNKFLRKHFSNLSKIALLLFTVSLSTAYYAGTFLYDKELHAYEAKFELEQLVGESIQNDCASLKEHVSKCQQMSASATFFL